MPEKLSKLSSPALAGVVREKSTNAAIAEIQNCIYDGATMIDLHLSCLEQTDTESLARIMQASTARKRLSTRSSSVTWRSVG